MGLIKGGAIRLLSTFLYFVSFICSMVIVGATGWFIASFSGSTRDFAIIGMASVAALYSFIAMLFTCCLAGISFFAVLAILFDIVLMAAMIAIAVLNRNARFGCGGDGSNTCRLYVATFACALIAVFAFLINAVLSFFLKRSGSSKRTRAVRA
ncbi:hypothetical protein BDZ85DRAFT_261126 [Elsinoe ampelina]|uniref:MARVEL domain-containing protein n=1 Tax=Elsinoe ampelina TaxID=302913 RepID=A0A6A6GFN3_9PEZI|nr:hypothetical protein BDZ85DRAFT_261126 [Elsinoe ampelina]